eukprot:6176389-Pleurochrysis_carterae.AAC.1
MRCGIFVVSELSSQGSGVIFLVASRPERQSPNRRGGARPAVIMALRFCGRHQYGAPLRGWRYERAARQRGACLFEASYQRQNELTKQHTKNKLRRMAHKRRTKIGN